MSMIDEKEMVLSKKTLPVWVRYMLVVSVPVLLFFGLANIMYPVIMAVLGEPYGFVVNVALTGLCSLVAVTPLWVFAKTEGASIKKLVGLNKPEGVAWVFQAAGVGLGFFTVMALSYFVIHFFTHVGTNETTASMSSYPWWSTMVASFVAAPVFEELVFRGTLFGYLTYQGSEGVRVRRVTVVAGAVLVAVFFASLHVTPGMDVVSAIAGVVSLGVFSGVLSWVRLKFDSIVPCMVVHAFYNTPIVVMSLLTS